MKIIKVCESLLREDLELILLKKKQKYLYGMLLLLRKLKSLK